MEQWRDVVGYEGRYQVSDLGRVKSLPNKRRFSTIILKNQPHKLSGHHMVTLTTTKLDGKGWRQIHTYVHLLVLTAFVGPCPAGMEGCHNDGNEQNNLLSNLRWDTHTGNMKDKKAHGTDNGGSRNPRAKLNEEQVRQIKIRLRAGEKESSIAPDYSVSPHTIKSIRLNQNWSHVA